MTHVTEEILDTSNSHPYDELINLRNKGNDMNETAEQIAKVNRETESLKKEMLGNGYRVRSDFGGMLTMTLQEWPHKSIVIDRNKGFIVDTIYPEA